MGDVPLIAAPRLYPREMDQELTFAAVGVLFTGGSLWVAWRQLRGPAVVLVFEHYIKSSSITSTLGTLDHPRFETHNGPTGLQLSLRNAGTGPVPVRDVGCQRGRWPRRRTASLPPGEPFTVAAGARRDWRGRWATVAEELGGDPETPMTFRPFAKVHGRLRRVYGGAISTTGREVLPAVVTSG